MRNRVTCNDRLERAAGNSSFVPLTCDFLVSRASLEGRKRVSRLDNRRLLDRWLIFCTDLLFEFRPKEF